MKYCLKGGAIHGDERRRNWEAEQAMKPLIEKGSSNPLLTAEGRFFWADRFIHQLLIHAHLYLSLYEIL